MDRRAQNTKELNSLATDSFNPRLCEGCSYISGGGLLLVLFVLSEESLLKFGLVFPQCRGIAIQGALVVRLPEEALDGQEDRSDVVHRTPLVLLIAGARVSDGRSEKGKKRPKPQLNRPLTRKRASHLQNVETDVAMLVHVGVEAWGLKLDNWWGIRVARAWSQSEGSVKRP